jgi:MarR family transcriptional regulator for hemolysin
MATAEKCASEVLDLIPLIMQSIRIEMRRQRGLDLSVPEFRALAFISMNPGTSLSHVAEHIGVALPSMSKIMDDLVDNKFVTRQTAPDDRRRIHLDLTPEGHAMLERARVGAKAALAEMLRPLSPEDRQNVTNAMKALRPVFEPASVARH